MPDHVHGLLHLVDRTTACRGGFEAFGKPVAGSVPTIMRSYKAADAPSARRAAWCNLYTLVHCDRLAVGHLNPGGMLACILSEADPEKEILYP